MTDQPTTPAATSAPEPDARSAHRAIGADGLLAEWNAREDLDAADVHVATRLAGLAGETRPPVLLATALTVRALRDGSVCLGLEALREEAAARGDDPGGEGWEQLLGSSPLVGDGRPLVLDGDLLYLQRYHAEETQVLLDLHRRAASRPPVDDQRLGPVLDELFPEPGYEDQRAAVATACRHWTSVVTGGPGTGKTTTVARLLGALVRLADSDGARPPRIAVAAPTGKAAARITAAIGEAAASESFPAEVRPLLRDLEATTVHRLLGSVPGGGARFRHHRGHQLPADVVVVDEASMLSLTLTARLTEAVRASARLVLVGDAEQLASVDAGAVLTDLVAGLRAEDGAAAPGASPVAQLGPTRRFGRRIGELADLVRQGDADGVVALLQQAREGAEDAAAERDGGVSWLPDPDALVPRLRAQALDLHHAADDAADAGPLLRILDRHRLLCAHRTGPAGVRWWNRLVATELADALGVPRLPESYAGRPLVVDGNDYGLGVFNGDGGVLMADPASPGRLVAAIDDARSSGGRLIPASRLGAVSTAYALTVHRAQGSQFDEVSVLLPDADSRVLSRELLYTALTRARVHVRVVGSEEALRAAVSRRARRASGLGVRLAGDRA